MRVCVGGVVLCRCVYVCDLLIFRVNPRSITVFPPKVLKYSDVRNDSATAGVVITAASGNPLPNGLPKVTGDQENNTW